MAIFISHSSADREIAEKIYERLKNKGAAAWISSRDIPPGGDYQACIVDTIEKAEIAVLVFSSNANQSPEIAKELSLASKNNFNGKEASVILGDTTTYDRTNAFQSLATSGKLKPDPSAGEAKLIPEQFIHPFGLALIMARQDQDSPVWTRR